ncbi:Fic family protein [Rhodococcus kroppenstedtii]|uniref:Fic/DOC family protein n=1 Tax=Rhodococcoides kroppenstedtii TaxID=293050 RepID=UPI0029554B84|nr:Fic family protein [Rhodococcus kroppenstedtii]MDV7198425.1 Fic family protein [Rhodococcus kroppenstedtii]
MTRKPWENDDPQQNWEGYFLGGSSILRNLVGAVTQEELTDAEVDLSEYRLLELRENPGIMAVRSYDLRHIRAIHKQLFQDVYEWAGEVRTVGLKKGGVSFCPPGNIDQAMRHVTDEILQSGHLRNVAPSELTAKIAYLYDYVNYAHPFREGNGRSTREFFDQLLAEGGLGLDWERVDSEELHAACHEAREVGNLNGLTEIFETIVDNNPAY